MKNRMVHIGNSSYINADKVSMIIPADAAKVRRILKKKGVDATSTLVWNATGDLEISKEAVCNVDVSVNSVVVSGKLKGDIVSQKFVEMKNGSSIQGNVTTSRIRIEDGVDFQGKISMVESAEKTDLFSMNSSEYKDSLTLYQGIDKK